MGFGVWNLGFGIWDLGFGVWDLGLGFRGFGFVVYEMSFAKEVTNAVRAGEPAGMGEILESLMRKP